MNTPDTVHARRDAILTAANEEMRRARAQRVRSARITSIAAVLLLGAITAATLPRTSSSNESRLEGTRALAIDFQSVATQAPTIDFAIVRSMDHQTTRTLTLEIVTDEEAEQSLLESGYCVKIFRVRNQPVLVDCSTGAPADFGVSRSFMR